MADNFAPFIDVERAVIALLSDLVDPATNVAVQTPSDLQANLPFIRVARLGGTDDRVTDSARIDVDCYSLDDRTVAEALAETVRQRLIAYPHKTTAGVIDKVATDVAPNEVPWANARIRRFTASYLVLVRR